TDGVNSEIVPPTQYGPPFVAVGVVAAVLTTTLVPPVSEVQPPVVTITEYVPASAAVAFGRVGLWAVEVKPFGPLQAYVAPGTAGVESEIVSPAQYGPPLLATAAAFESMTFVVPAAEVQPLTVTVTAYVPKSAAVALGRVGFCCGEVKPFGPVQPYVAAPAVRLEGEVGLPWESRPP